MAKNGVSLHTINLWIDPLSPGALKRLRQSTEQEEWWDAEELYWKHGACDVFAAKNDGRIVGVLAFRIQDDIADVLDLRVDPAKQRLQVGTKMIARLAMAHSHFPRPRPFNALRMMIPLRDAVAKLFLESNHFHHVDTETDEDDASMAVMMRKA